jgi:hypothetical protein
MYFSLLLNILKVREKFVDSWRVCTDFSVTCMPWPFSSNAITFILAQRPAPFKLRQIPLAPLTVRQPGRIRHLLFQAGRSGP